MPSKRADDCVPETCFCTAKIQHIISSQAYKQYLFENLLLFPLKFQNSEFLGISSKPHASLADQYLKDFQCCILCECHSKVQVSGSCKISLQSFRMQNNNSYKLFTSSAYMIHIHYNTIFFCNMNNSICVLVNSLTVSIVFSFLA